MADAMTYHVEDPQGNSTSFTSDFIANDLKANGQPIVRVSPDGQFITLQDSQGEFDVDVKDVLPDYGWKIKGSEPANAVYDYVNPQWRAVVSDLLPDDDSRRAYIEGQMRKMGHANPQVTGSGSDWFVFNPETNNWIATTNTPKWFDKGDLAEAAAMGGKMLGNAAGTIAGAPAGPLGMAAGAGLGGMAANTAIKTGLGLSDELAGYHARQNLGKISANVAVGGILDSALALAGGMIPTRGLVSGAVKGAGAAGEVIGDVGAKAANVVAKPAISDIAGAFAYPTASLGAMAAKLPGGAVKVGAQAPNAAANALLWAAEKAQAAGKPQLAEELIARAWGPAAATESLLAARNVGTNFAEKAAATLAQNNLFGQAAQRTARSADIVGNAAEMAGFGKSGVKTAEKIGSTLDSMGGAADFVESAIRKPIQLTAKAARAGFSGIKNAGIAANRTSTVLQPMENQLIARGAVDKYVPQLGEEFYQDIQQNPIYKATQAARRDIPRGVTRVGKAVEDLKAKMTAPRPQQPEATFDPSSFIPEDIQAKRKDAMRRMMLGQ